MSEMGRFTSWGLMLSILCSVAVVAYRNDLSSTRHGCIWSTIDPSGVKESASTVSTNPLTQQGQFPLLMPSSTGAAAGGVSLNCNLRTLSVDFWNYTFNREQIERTRFVRIKCSDKLFFESSLSPNQTLFQLRNLNEVQIESCKIRKIGRVFGSLKNLKSLVIHTQNTEWRSTNSVGLEIEANSFDSLESLESLDLSNNNIWSFPKNVLCPLRQVTKVNVSQNRLSDIDELISSQDDNNGGGSNYCAMGVVDLDLSHNMLRRVGQNAFTRMPRLSELRLQNNLISEMEDTAFSGLSQLKLLNLSSNRLVALPPTIFSSVKQLRELYLQNNSISALSPQVFRNMDRLQLVDLSSNILTSQWMKEDVFQSLIRVVVIKLSKNQLSYIDSELFKNLGSLQALHLDRNRIETISAEAFHSLQNLHILDLTFNRLSFVDSRLFSNLFVLRQLYLDHNKLRKLDEDSLKNCTSVQDVGLSANSFQEVPVALRGLGQLTMLDLGDNKIAKINNDSFSGLSALYGLRIAENRITEIDSGFCGNLRKLRVLNLSKNLINKIDNAFSVCQDLRVLRLDANSIQEFPSLAPQLPNLLWLNVSENQIKLADYSLLPSTLEWFDISYNALETISNSNPTQMPSHLRVFDASYNKLKHLDSSVIAPSLETLRMNQNELKSVAPDTFILSKRLRRVELIGNQIETLPLTSLRFSPIPSGRTLPDFYLGSNPFICSCEMEYLSSSRLNQLSILRQYPRIVDLDAIVCRTTFSRSALTYPSNQSQIESHALIPLVEARPKDFLCPYKSHCFALCHCCEFDACDCEMTCPGNCSCYHDSAWSTNIVECSNLNYEDVPARIPMDATELYLDGNRIYQLSSHIFIGKKNLRTLHLNDSHVEVIKNKTFNGLKSLEILRLEENLLTELIGYEFADLESLKELYLQNNLIKFIGQDTFVNLKYLQVLRLDGNLIRSFEIWHLSKNSYLNSLAVSGNPWSCDCEFLNLFRSVTIKTAIKIVDFSLAKCQMYSESNSWSDSDIIENSGSTSQVRELQFPISMMCNGASFNYDQSGNTNEIETDNQISPMGGVGDKVAIPQSQPPSENHFSRLETNSDNALWTLILCLTAILIVIGVILVIFHKEIYHFISNSKDGSARLLCCCCPRKFGSHHPGKTCQSSSEEKLFDAYFLYSKKDEDMLFQKIAPELESDYSGSQNTGSGHKFRLCLHYRDLCLSPESPWNREMILSACDASKKIVIILSKTFLQSEWGCSPLFRSSIQSAISLHQKKVIFITLPDFDQSLSTISSDLSSSTVKNSSLQWSDKNFWSKFRKLLPAPSNNNGGGGTMISGESVNYQMQSQCDPNQLPYQLVINPNLQNLQYQIHSQTMRAPSTHHYHQNIIPYQIPVPPAPMSRNNSLPPIPKHQIVLPAPNYNNSMNWEPQGNNTTTTISNGLLNPSQFQHHHNGIIAPNNHSVIHPIPSQLTPQQFGYSNETFHLQHSNHHQNHHHLHPGHNNHNQPIHFSSQQNPHQLQGINVIPPHSHTSSQISNTFSSSVCYPHTHNRNQIEQNYSSSAVSSCANDEFDHVYSTLDSPLQSPMLSKDPTVEFSPNGNSQKNNRQHQRNCHSSNGGGGSSASESANNCPRMNSKHIAQHSTSSGVSSGSDMTSSAGEISSSAVSPSSPIKNGIINKLNANNMGGNTNTNGKMYFV